MIKGDYVERSRVTKSGKTVVDKIVTSTTGVEYAIGPRLGSGGVAKVFRARRLSDKAEFAFKEYAPSPETRRVHRAIKRNIQTLIKTPLTESDGTPLTSFIGPLDKDSVIELPASGGWGYIMELVDTEAFLSVPKLRHPGIYPDAKILCIACMNIASFFRRVHFSGWCYKDINEGNIYINNKTGEIRVIDCDNISVQSTRTIKGTDGFMAPEVYDGVPPDSYTDYFSMAVLYYRLLIGGFPMDGKKTYQYLIENNLSIQEAASKIYGNMALFAFDPQDHSNEIRGLVDPRNPKLYAGQTAYWDNLPKEIQDGFIKTFSVGLSNDNRTKRATDRDWMVIFENLLKEGLVTCKCGKKNFGDRKAGKLCIYCEAKLPLIPKKPVSPPKPTKQPKPTPQPAQQPKPQTQSPISTSNELTTVVFRAKRDIAPTGLSITVKRKHSLPGKGIHPNLSEDWMKIEYNKTKNLLAAVNLSQNPWSVSDNGVKTVCNPGERVILKKGLVITVLYRQLQLTVDEIK